MSAAPRTAAVTEELEAATFDAYLRKPFDLHRLIDTITRLLQRPS